jgi:TrmH family RNA methyltransferase
VTAAKITAITSRGNPLLARLRRLNRQPDAYRKLGQVWLEGEQVCRASLRAGREIDQAVIGEAAWDMAGLRELAGAAIRVAIVPDALMASLSPLETSASIAFVARWPGTGSLRADAPSLVLDRLQDAGNVGTILRSAAAFGFSQVISLEGTAALWAPKVVRAAMGAHFALDLVERASLADLDALQVPLVATSSHAKDALHETALPWPCAWAFGNEAQGLEPNLLGRCRATLRIAQPGGEESLNVAIAAAVCMYESTRQRLRR